MNSPTFYSPKCIGRRFAKVFLRQNFTLYGILLCICGCMGKQIDVTKVINKPGVLTIGMYMEMNHLEPNNYCHDPPYTIYAVTKGDWYKT